MGPIQMNVVQLQWLDVGDQAGESMVSAGNSDPNIQNAIENERGVLDRLRAHHATYAFSLPGTML